MQAPSPAAMAVPKTAMNPLEREPLASFRWTREGLTFFNRMPRASHLPVVESVPFAVETFSSAFVPALFHPTLPPDTFSGAVYRKDGTIVPEFLEYDALTQHRVPKRVNPPIIDRARVADAVGIDGPCVYLGPLSSHFGHFLLESLPRAWFLRDADPTTLLLFHGQETYLPSFARAIFDAMEIDPSRIRAASRDINVGRLILPASQFWQGIKASPGMCVLFDHIREKILKRRRNAPPTPPKVYFTRRSLDPVMRSGKSRAVIPNEEEAELFFRRRGYEILRPETLPLEEQIAIVAGATHVAGPSGSALHLMLFNNNPQASLIELRTKRAANQLLISSIRGNAAFHVWSAKESSPGRVVLDMDAVERAVKMIEA